MKQITEHSPAWRGYHIFWTRQRIGAAILVGVIGVGAPVIFLWYGSEHHPPMSREAKLALHMRNMLPEGIERFLITDINNPAASCTALSMLQDVEDPEVQRRIFELSETYLGMQNVMGPEPSTPSFVDDPNKNYWPGHITEVYDSIPENPFQSPCVHPLSTFSIDVDTASYANVRRLLREGVPPPPGAVRIEELINYFDYAYPAPELGEPFALNAEVAACPWKPDHRLVRLGLRARDIEEVPPCNLVFLIDVSGSMSPENKLPLLKRTIPCLVRQLRPVDRISLVVYASQTGQILAPTPGNRQRVILDAIESLGAGGSTNGAGGIQQAYHVAQEAYLEEGVNRVILATDGDFNVGITDRSQLVELIRTEAQKGIFLSVLGVGMGNLKDATLEQLADKGNGNYAYIDTTNEARKVLVEQMSGTLVAIAKDVKIQVEFNPALVQAYRLIGYDNRMMAAEDFNNDAKDAGDMGAGHRVTALYEVVPHGVRIDVPEVDALQYQTGTAIRDMGGGELLTMKVRYKEPDGTTSRKLELRVADRRLPFRNASPDFQFAAAVAGYGMLLRHSEFLDDFDYSDVRRLANAGLGADDAGYRTEFLGLVETASRLNF